MSLINCPECNKQISTKAEICVGCGAPVVLSYIIGKTSIIEFESFHTRCLEIAERNFEELMSWNEANKKCNEIGYGWRLPTKAELGLIWSYKNEISGLTSGFYWSSNKPLLDLSNYPFNIINLKYYYGVWFNFETNKNTTFQIPNKKRQLVRAVRTTYLNQ